MVNWGGKLKRFLERTELPLYLRIYQGIKEVSMTEEMETGVRMPTIRGLAKELGVNNGTVARAYHKLEEEGYIYTHVGKGTFLRLMNHKNLCDKSDCKNFKWSKEKEGLGVCTGKFIDLASTTPSPEFFPVDGFKRAINSVLDRDGGRAFSYHEGKGFYPLRQKLCEYIKEHSIKVSPSDIQVTTGAQQGIDLIAKSIVKQWDVIYLERPSYTGAMAAFMSRGAILVDVPMDQYGIDPNILENLVKKKHPRLVYIMPNFHSPTGLSYSDARRRELISLAEKYDFLLVEDDYLGELQFTSVPFLPIKALDENNERVIYLKSFSKIFMPGLRLGFMVLPTDVQEQVEDAKRYSDISTSGLIQRAFEVYLDSNEWRIHLEILKTEYSRRHNYMEQVLRKHEGVFNFLTPGGGLSFWVSIPGELTGYEVAQKALEKRVRVTAGESFYLVDCDKSRIRLGYANAVEDEIEKGIQTIVGLVLESITKNKRGQ